MKIRMAVAADQAVWDEYVDGHSNATPYHRFAWLLSIVDAYKHKNVSLLAFVDDKIVGVLPAINMRIPFKGELLCSLPYCDVGFVLSDNDEIRDQLLNQLQTVNPEIQKHEYRDSDHQILLQEKPGQKVRMQLTLPDSSEKLMSGFKSKLRSQIRKAHKNGLRFEIGCSQLLLDQFYQVFIHNMRKLGSPVHSKVWYQCLFETYKNDMLISVVYSKDKPVGAGIVLLNNDKACIPWASTLAEFNRLAPNMLLYWSLLEYVSDNGFKHFDFGRSTFGEGTFKFKQQWGAEPISLNWYLPNQYEAIENTNLAGNIKVGNIRTMVEKTWSLMPLGITTWLGPKVRKYISL
jgi:FemAB-related protein (PEP-CTERM system-associated)